MELSKLKYWISVIDDVLVHYDLSQVLLIVHSLGCDAIVHWLQKINIAVFIALEDVGVNNFKERITSNSLFSYAIK